MRYLLGLTTALGLFLVAGISLTATSAQEMGSEGAVSMTHVGEEGHGDHGDHGEGHSIPLYAEEIFHIGPMPVTNSMVVTWGVAILLVLLARKATQGAGKIPTGLQNFAEWLVESMYQFLEGILGKELNRKTFWFFGTLFFFILLLNWFALIPGVGTLGWQIEMSDGSTHFSPWLRGANADLNMTSAMALLFFALWIVWAIQANGGVGGVIKHLFGVKGKERGFMKVFLIVVFLLVGVLETVSILFRPVSLSFRLFGNIFAGENILESMMIIVPPYLAWLTPLPFYFLELLVGLIQALVFTLLTAVFTLLICEHDEEHHEEEAH